MSLRRVSPGAPLRIAAGDFNACLDAAEAHRARRHGLTSAPAPSSAQTGIHLVRNDTGADLDQFAVVGLGDLIITPADNEAAFRSDQIFAAATPDLPDHDERFAILQEPLKAGAIGRGMLIGNTPVRVVIRHDTDRCAGPIAGDSTRLESQDVGPAQILWREPGGAGSEVWAVVRLPFRLKRVRLITRNALDRDDPGTVFEDDGDWQHSTESGAERWVALKFCRPVGRLDAVHLRGTLTCCLSTDPGVGYALGTATLKVVPITEDFDPATVTWATAPAMDEDSAIILRDDFQLSADGSDAGALLLATALGIDDAYLSFTCPAPGRQAQAADAGPPATAAERWYGLMLVPLAEALSPGAFCAVKGTVQTNDLTIPINTESSWGAQL